MTSATMPQAVQMRPVTSTADSFAAVEILMLFIGDEPWKLDDLVPGGSTFNAVEIAEDGSAAAFEVFAGSDWSATNTTALGRAIVRRFPRSLTWLAPLSSALATRRPGRRCLHPS